MNDLVLVLLFAVSIPSGISIAGGFDTSDVQSEGKSSGPPLTMRFAGDCLLAGHYELAATDSVSVAFDGFDLLKTADISMVNLECPITIRGQKVAKPYNFRMHPRLLSELVSAGIDVVNLANNHIYDYGKVGLFDTISYLDSVGIRHVGAGRNETEAHAPVLISSNGRTVAIFGYYGGGEAPKASGKRAGVADRSFERTTRDIQKLRRSDSNAYIVVNLHWGTEKATIPDVAQKVFAHSVIDAGANLIVGHHPHVLQGIEQYGSGIIAYSLGNFVFGGNSRDTYDTAILEVRLFSDRNECSVVPIRVEQWKVRELKGGEGDAVIEQVRRLSAGFPASVFTQ